MELRTVGVHEVDLIEDLFQEVYNRAKGLNYWRWCFKNPHGYLNSGMFEGNRLLGYHASSLTEISACMYSAMTHPKHRRKGIFTKLTTDLHERLSLIRDYVFLFSNKMIRPIHIEKEGYQEVYPLQEYRIPFNKENMIKPIENFLPFFSKYRLWRYRDNPIVKYFFHYDDMFNNIAIFSLYEDRVQIVEYVGNIHQAIDVGQYIAFAHNKHYISFWDEIEWGFPSILIPTWKHYKILNPLNIDIEDIMKNDRTRMGCSDVF